MRQTCYLTYAEIVAGTLEVTHVFRQKTAPPPSEGVLRENDDLSIYGYSRSNSFCRASSQPAMSLTRTKGVIVPELIFLQ